MIMTLNTTYDSFMEIHDKSLHVLFTMEANSKSAIIYSFQHRNTREGLNGSKFVYKNDSHENMAKQRSEKKSKRI